MKRSLSAQIQRFASFRRGNSVAQENRRSEREEPLPDEGQRPDPSLDFNPYQVGLENDLLSGWHNKMAGELARGFPVTADDLVLDVGCGDGEAAAFCAECGARIILADINPARIEKASTWVESKSSHPVTTLTTDANPLPLTEALVSRVICMEVLEHVADPDAFMAELVRVGLPGALYLFTVPAARHEAIQKIVAPAFYFEHPHHIRVFETKDFHGLITRSGLKIEQSWPDGFFWSLWLAFFWQTGIQLGERHPTFNSWAATWKMVIDGPDGARVKRALDEALPQRQVVVARKPE